MGFEVGKSKIIILGFISLLLLIVSVSGCTESKDVKSTDENKELKNISAEIENDILPKVIEYNKTNTGLISNFTYKGQYEIIDGNEVRTGNINSQHDYNSSINDGVNLIFVLGSGEEYIGSADYSNIGVLNFIESI